MLAQQATNGEDVAMGPEISIHLERYRAVYVEIPKVACTTLKVALAPLVDIDLHASGGNPHLVDFPRPPQTPEPKGGTLYPGSYAFSFVRNPWDRLVSCYRDKIRGEVDGFTSSTVRPGVADCLAGFDAFFPNMTFGEFVKAVASIPDTEADEHFRSQSTFIVTDQGDIGVDFVGRFENLQSDFERVSRRIGLPSRISLPRLQAARRTASYLDYFTRETRQIVAERFRDDIDRFSYRFDSSLRGLPV